MKRLCMKTGWRDLSRRCRGEQRTGCRAGRSVYVGDGRPAPIRPCFLFHRLLCMGACLIALWPGIVSAEPPPGIERVNILACETLSNGKVGLRIDVVAGDRDETALVLVARGMTPLGWARPLRGRSEERSAAHAASQPGARATSRTVDSEALRPNFVGEFALREIDTPDKLRAWAVRPQLVAELRPRWPENAPLTTVIDSIGPGQRHAWLIGGTDRGFTRDQSWWLRLAGQPIARFDTRYVCADLSYCVVTPLVADAPLSAEQSVESWPTPSDLRNGRVASAVVFAEDIGSDQRVWIAAPPEMGFPREPRVDFLRGGRFVGRGVVELRDAVFWYVRVSARACLERIVVGDEAQVRTLTMIHRREFVAHVFESVPEGYLIDAGEAENVAVDQIATAWREGRSLGTVIVSRVQNDYATVRQPPDGSAEPLQRGDEIRFAPRQESGQPRIVGEIDQVVDGSIFTVVMQSNRKPSARVPLGVRRGPRMVGAVLLIDVTDSVGLGFVIGDPSTAAVERGALLVESIGQAP